MPKPTVLTLKLTTAEVFTLRDALVHAQQQAHTEDARVRYEVLFKQLGDVLRAKGV